MTAGRSPLLLLALAAGLAGPAAGQALLTQPGRYLLTTEPHDGRALWVQPAALVRRREASLGASVTASRAAGTTTLEQYGLTAVSSGLALGWQRSRLLDGSSINQYAVGFGFGGQPASLGVTRRWIRGDRVKDGAFDIGLRAAPSRLLELSLTWRDLGSPVVSAPPGIASPEDTTYRPTLIPAAAVTLLGNRLRLGADWELVTAGWGTSAVRLGAGARLPFNLSLSARAEFTHDFERRDVAVAISWNGSGARVAAFQSVPRAGPRYTGLWGAAVRDLERRSTRRPRFR